MDIFAVSFSSIYRILLAAIYIIVSARILTPIEFGQIAIVLSAIAISEAILRLGLIQTYIKNAMSCAKTISSILQIVTFNWLIFSIGIIVLYYNTNVIKFEEIDITCIQLALSSILASIYCVTIRAYFSVEQKYILIVKYEVISLTIVYLIGIPYLTITEDWKTALIMKLLIDTVHTLSLLWKGQLRLKCTPLGTSLEYLLKNYVFGTNILLANLVNVLSLKLQDFYLVAYGGLLQLGNFNRAQVISNIPLEILNQLLERYFFPKFSNLRDKNNGLKIFTNQLADSFGALMISLLAVSIYFASSLINPIVALVLGPTWDIALMAQLFILGAYFRIIYKVGDVIVKSCGAGKSYFAYNTIQLVSLLILLVYLKPTDASLAIVCVSISYFVRMVLTVSAVVYHTSRYNHVKQQATVVIVSSLFILGTIFTRYAQ